MLTVCSENTPGNFRLPLGKDINHELSVPSTSEADRLLACFELSCKSETDWCISDASATQDLCLKIQKLSTTLQLNKKQTQRICAIIQEVFPPENSELQLNLARLFTCALNKETMIDHLKLSLEKKCPLLQTECAAFIEKATGMKISINDSTIAKITIGPGHLPDLTHVYIPKIAAIARDLVLDVSPDSTHEVNDFRHFLETHGKYIQRLQLHNYLIHVDDSLVIKIIRSCPNLVSFSISSRVVSHYGLREIGKLKFLEFLYILYSDKLTRLPKGIADLTNLRLLSISQCGKITKLPDQIVNLPKLLTLKLYKCVKLKSLPKKIGNLTSLITLDLWGSHNLATLPSSLCDLLNLRVLDLSWCIKISKLPLAIGRLSNLENLKLLGLKKLVQLPPGICQLKHLQSLLLSKCDSLTKLPIEIARLTSLKALGLTGCSKLNIENQTALFAKMLEIDFEWGLNFYESFLVLNDAAVGKLISDRYYDKIKPNLSVIKYQLRRTALIPITIAFLEREPEALFENLKYFPLKDLPHADIAKSSALNPFLCYKTNEALAFKKTAKVPGNSLDKVPNVNTRKLLNFFDNINFENPQEIAYRDPNKLTIDGVPSSKERVRLGIILLLKRIEDIELFTGVPSDLDMRIQWYQRLENLLKIITKKMEEGEDPVVVTDGLLSLGAAGHQCGSRWLSEAADVKKSLEGKLEEDSVEETLLTWNDSYKEGFLYDLSLKYTQSLGRSMQPHIFNLVAKTLTDNNITLPEKVVFDSQDALMPSGLLPIPEIMDLFLDYYYPLAYAHYILGMVEGSNYLIKGKMIESLKAYAESRLLDLSEHASEKKQFERSCDTGMKGVILQDILLDDGLLRYNEETDVIRLTLLGALKLLEHNGYLKRES